MGNRENKAPIGIFDSGVGGLTVAHAIAQYLPHENIIYVGDSAHCPYGPRSLDEVQNFVDAIVKWLQHRGVKLIVIACNTATAAALSYVQSNYRVPVIGVVKPGARAAVRATRNKNIGVIATAGTINSNIYQKTIRDIDSSVSVYSVAAPQFVDLIEQGVRTGKVTYSEEFHKIAKTYLDPLRKHNVDTLVLGCTHFPLMAPQIAKVMGDNVELVTSSRETALDVCDMLQVAGMLAPENNQPCYKFFTTGSNLDDFRAFGQRVFQRPLDSTEYADIW